MAVYKIWHPESNDMFAAYVESDMNLSQVADIAVGLQFFLEDECEYGDAAVDEQAVACFLCTFFNCKPGSADAWARAAREEYKARISAFDPNDRSDMMRATIGNIVHGTSVDLFCERECRCGPGCDTYVRLITPYQNTDFMKALKKHYNSEDSLSYPFEFHA